MPKTAVSAGGVIVKKVDNETFVLLIRDLRYPEWYLPKGHVEADESLQETALREVAEEAGIKHLKVEQEVGVYERYVPSLDEQKTIHYFLMTPTEDEVPRPTENVDVEIKWFSVHDLPELYLDEHRDVIEKVKQLIINR